MGKGQPTLESLDMMLFGDIYRGRRVLVTGHTGFKGSWLALWLKTLGAEVTGIALDPDTAPNHWDLLALPVDDRRQDIRDAGGVGEIVAAVRPDIVFHLAAQPLVRRSYRDPIGNWSANVMGTAHVLEACRRHDSVKAIVAITTDKVYDNREWPWGYRETDRLGGHDPYSASKAACELLIDSYRNAFFQREGTPLLASARAGNVIGGGDWSEDRLIPDLVRAIRGAQPLVIRSPKATRPWQHVLDCLSGYLMLGRRLLEGRRDHAVAWNFGPSVADNRTVEEMLELLKGYWPELLWEVTQSPQPREATLLYLDHAKARDLLDWRPVWPLNDTLRATADWYRRFHEDGTVLSGEQIAEYTAAANSADASWTRK